MKKRILIVDDSKTQLGSLKIFLTKAGYDVVTATDGVEAIQAVYKYWPDLIVSDIVMPNINGYQLCRLLKDDENTKNIPIILLTVLDKKLDKFWGLRAGAEAFFSKDSNFGNLIIEIGKFVEKTPSLTNEDRELHIQKTELVDSSFQSKINDILDKALIEATIMNEFRNLSELVHDTEAMNKGIFSVLASILDYHFAGIFFNNRDEKKEKVLYTSENEYGLCKELIDNISNNFFAELFSGSANYKQDYFCSSQSLEKNTDKEASTCNESAFKSKIVIPIIFEGKIMGGICLYHFGYDKFASSKIFHIILEELKLLMRIKWLYSEAKFLSVTDSLTGLYNRRFFQQTLEREFSRSKRYSNHLSMALIDIDNFKRLNDTYGHQFGDKVLAEIALLIQKSFRKTDCVARYGGEEFISILAETSLERALIPLGRLRETVENVDFKYNNEIVKVTISIGVATISDKIVNESNFIKATDSALYEAKNKGRNRIEIFDNEFEFEVVQ